MSAPIDEFDLDIRLGEVLDEPLASMVTGQGYCPSDDCSSYPICQTNEPTC